MSEQCKFPACTRHAERNGYCFLHAVHFAGEKPPKAKVPIPKESKKRIAEKKKYKKIVAGKAAENPLCQLQIPGVCTIYAQGGDHVQKRSPANYAEEENIVLACNACNSWKEKHPKEAKALGLSVSKFKKNQNKRA